MDCSLTIMATRGRAARAGVFAAALGAVSLAVTSCNGSTPSSPDPVATRLLASVTISGSTSLAGPGHTAQLSAIAGYSNGATENVTATAVWQTSNPAVATVSGGGLLTGQGAGTADVTATYQGQTGRAGVTVAAPPCSVSLSETSVTFARSGGTRTVGVQASSSSCAWQAGSSASWLHITSGGGGTGNGTVSYFVEPNTGPTTREGVITIGGPAVAAEQRLTVRQTTSGSACRYCPSPSSRSFSSAGGTSSISVDPVDSSIDWTAVSDQPWLRVVAGSAGRGRGTVTYVVDRNGFGVTRSGTISVGGLSGAFARETHVVTQQP